MNLINKNGVDIIYKINKNTPRTAITLMFKINEEEKYAGTYSLFSRLLLQGTKNYDSNQIAILLENEGIQLSVKFKVDYFKIDILFLNNDVDVALHLLSDIILNSTFDDFEKEKIKFKTEILANHDDLRTFAFSNFVHEFYKNHFYAHTSVQILKDIDKIKLECVKNVLNQILDSKKVISVVGDFDEDLLDKISKKLSFMKSSTSESKIKTPVEFKENKIIKIKKNEANQAHIIQGFHAPSYSSDYPKIALMNNLLGASGLSSRLFYNLRDRLGLAYHVRSSYDVFSKSSCLSFYIGTNPNNIEKCLLGFSNEISKIMNELCEADELQGAKENIFGRIAYFSQTNAALSSIFAYNYITDLGLDFEERYKKMLNEVKKDDIKEVANKYLSKNSLTLILAPSKFLK